MPHTTPRAQLSSLQDLDDLDAALVTHGGVNGDCDPCFRNMTLERVNNLNTFVREWYPALTSIFTDPDDLETLDELASRFNLPELNHFFLLRNHKREPIGIELAQVNPEIPGAMYVPWAGLAENYRNKGIYPRMVKISDDQMKKAGVKYSLYDFEDPACIHIAYPDEPEGVPAKRAEGCINFWRRSVNCYVVNDPDLPYMRSLSSDTKKIQTYDNFAFRALNEKDTMWKNVFNEDKTGISKAVYRQFYLEMNRLQYGNLSETELCAAYPSIQQFLAALDASPKQWVRLDTTPIRPNARSNPRVTVDYKETRKIEAIFQRVPDAPGRPRIKPAVKQLRPCAQ